MRSSEPPRTWVELLDAIDDPSHEARAESSWRPWIAAAAFAAVGFLLGTIIQSPPPEPSLPSTVRLTVLLPQGHELVVQQGRGEIAGRYPPVAISRDGSRIAFAARGDDGVSRLYLRTMDSLEPHVVSGTENAELPFFSPDGKWLGFLVEDQVSKAPLDGGVPIAIGKPPLGTARGAAWAKDGTIVLGGANAGLARMDAETGETEPLTQLDSERVENYHAWPFVLPDGEHVLFTVEIPTGHALAVLSLETREWHLLEQTKDATQAHYLESGHLLIFRSGGLFAASFSLSRLAIEGTIRSVPMGDLVEGWNAGLEHGYFAASASGSLVFVPGTIDLQQNLIVRVDRMGTSQAISDPGRYAFTPAVSPDGSRLVAGDTIPQSGASDDDLFLLDLERGSRTRLTPDGASIEPRWSADGQHVFFVRFGAGGDSDLYRLAADGGGRLELLADRPFDQTLSDVSRDGGHVGHRQAMSSSTRR